VWTWSLNVRCRSAQDGGSTATPDAQGVRPAHATTSHDREGPGQPQDGRHSPATVDVVVDSASDGSHDSLIQVHNGGEAHAAAAGSTAQSSSGALPAVCEWECCRLLQVCLVFCCACGFAWLGKCAIVRGVSVLYFCASLCANSVVRWPN
jgi:hypothetical protein